MSAAQFPELLSLLSEIKEKASAVTQRCTAVKKENAGSSVDVSKGISLLDAKVQLLISYLNNVSLLVLMKLEGKRIEDHPVVMRLVELRTVLEKIRPIDLKLKYQIDKLLKLAMEPTAASTLDPLRARPNPNNLISVDENGQDIEGDEDGDSDEDGDNDALINGDLNFEDRDAEAAAAGLYVPPRIASMPYDLDDQRKKKKKDSDQDDKHYGLNRVMLQELRDQYHDGPEEMVDSSANKSRKRGRDEEDQMRYEEDHLTRLPGKKKKKSTIADGLSALHSFGEGGGEGQRAQKSKGKGFSKKGGKKKGSFKRKRR
eukprot:scpid80448/ scgid13805/ Neuroguidin; EIF4E-binding protein